MIISSGNVLPSRIPRPFSLSAPADVAAGEAPEDPEAAFERKKGQKTGVSGLRFRVFLSAVTLSPHDCRFRV